MKSHPQLDPRTIARMAPDYANMLSKLSTGRLYKAADLKREAAVSLEHALFRLARKLRADLTSRELAAHISEAREQALQAIADIIEAQHPHLKPLLHHITKHRPSA